MVFSFEASILTSTLVSSHASHFLRYDTHDPRPIDFTGCPGACPLVKTASSRADTYLSPPSTKNPPQLTDEAKWYLGVEGHRRVNHRNRIQCIEERGAASLPLIWRFLNWHTRVLLYSAISRSSCLLEIGRSQQYKLLGHH